MQTDEALAARLVDGDELALRELLRRYERPLAAFLHRQTGGRDVEDLYQETWLRVVRHAARFDTGRRFSTWLFQIAVNLCRDWHRRPPPSCGSGGGRRCQSRQRLTAIWKSQVEKRRPLSKRAAWRTTRSQVSW